MRATWARSAGPYVRMSAPDLAASDDSQASSPQEQSRAVQRRRKALRRPSAPQLVSPFALPEVQQQVRYSAQPHSRRTRRQDGRRVRQAGLCLCCRKQLCHECFALLAISCAQTVPPEPVKASQMVSKSRSKPRTRVPAEPPAKPETAPLVPHPIATKPPKAPVAKPAPASRYPEASPVTTPTSSQQQSCDSLTMKSDVKGAVVGAPKQVLADKTAGTYMSSPEAHNVRVVEHASCWPRWLACFSRA